MPGDSRLLWDIVLRAAAPAKAAAEAWRGTSHFQRNA